MKSIFISIPWFHPAFRAGGPVQSVANMVNEFNEDVDYRIFCANTDLNETTLENIEVSKWVPYNDHTKVWYADRDNRSETILKEISSAKPGILYIVGIFSWHFNIVPLIWSKVPNKIVSVRGMLHPGALSQKNFKKKIFLALWKISGIHKKVLFHATDEVEKNFIKEVFGEQVRVNVAGNFPRKFSQLAKQTKFKGDLHLLSIALISPMKNHLLVLQALEKCEGTIVYHICGPVKDMEYWQQCLQQVKKLPANITVLYHGDVQPQQVETYFNKAQVFILPSKSENFGHAFYEALSGAMPVITSMHTPWKELEKDHAGLNVDLDTASVKNAIDRFVMMDEDEYRSWSKAAMHYAEKAVDVELIKLQYREMFSG